MQGDCPQTSVPTRAGDWLFFVLLLHKFLQIMKRNDGRSRVARPRIPYLVCRCLPNGVVTHLEARLLRDLVNREIHPIRCAQSCRRK